MGAPPAGPQGGRGERLADTTSLAQENDQKRIRALKKANKERDLKRQRMRELAKAKQEMAALRLQHQQLSGKLQNYSIFNKYLEKVVESSEVSGGRRGAFLGPTSSAQAWGYRRRRDPLGGCPPTLRAAGKGPWSGLGPGRCTLVSGQVTAVPMPLNGGVRCVWGKEVSFRCAVRSFAGRGLLLSQRPLLPGVLLT